MAVIHVAGPWWAAAPVLEVPSGCQACWCSIGSRPCLGVTVGYHAAAQASFLSGAPTLAGALLATCGALSWPARVPIDWSGLPPSPQVFSDTDWNHHNSHRGFWLAATMGWTVPNHPATAACPPAHAAISARTPTNPLAEQLLLLLQIPLGCCCFWIEARFSGAGGWARCSGASLAPGVVYPFTWLVNSATPPLGGRPAPSGDAVAHNPWVAC